MATVWAKHAGSWSTASIWAFWNETTQQIEDYGQIPQNDDIVYLNGFSVSLGTTSVTYIAKEIHNGANPYTGIAGGSLNGYNFTLVSDLYSEYSSSLYSSNFNGTTRGFMINGNIYIIGNSPSFNISLGGYSTVKINGNIYADSYNGIVFQQATNYVHVIIVNGSVIAPYATLATSYTGTSSSYITINGNCEVANLQTNGSVSM
ncbi:MAG: hypothetical protein IIW86_05480 [Clostridia bacterium]|nr:hypothetical protein [Clostridia bacterium]